MRFVFLAITFPLFSKAHVVESGKAMGMIGSGLFTSILEDRYEEKAPIRYFPGILIQADVDKYASLEFSWFYIYKSYFRRSNDEIRIESVERMHLGLGYRHWFRPYVSAALIYDASYSAGSPKILRTSSPDFATIAQDNSEVGFSFSIQYDLQEKYILDLRYYIATDENSGESADHLMLYIAYKFPVNFKTSKKNDKDPVELNDEESSDLGSE